MILQSGDVLDLPTAVVLLVRGAGRVSRSSAVGYLDTCRRSVDLVDGDGKTTVVLVERVGVLDARPRVPDRVRGCIPDADDPWGLVRRMMSHLAPGSYLAISHLVSDDPEVRRKITDFLLAATGGQWGRVRQEDDVRAFFEGLEIADPGLVEVTAWRPDGKEEEQTFEWIEYGGVARKPPVPSSA